ncbi:MAG: hypothetical protein QXO61_05450, partial [Acidilobaceae archaeon]
SCDTTPIAELSKVLASLDEESVLEVWAEEGYLPLETLLFVLEKRGEFRVIETQKLDQAYLVKITRGGL